MPVAEPVVVFDSASMPIPPDVDVWPLTPMPPKVPECVPKTPIPLLPVLSPSIAAPVLDTELPLIALEVDVDEEVETSSVSPLEVQITGGAGIGPIGPWAPCG